MGRLIRLFSTTLSTSLLMIFMSIFILDCSNKSSTVTSEEQIDAKSLHITDISISGVSYESIGEKVHLDGVVKNNSTKTLTGVRVHAKVYQDSTFVGSGQDELKPSTLPPGASGDFWISVGVSCSFRDANIHKLTPQCDAGVGNTQIWEVNPKE